MRACSSLARKGEASAGSVDVLRGAVLTGEAGVGEGLELDGVRAGTEGFGGDEEAGVVRAAVLDFAPVDEQGDLGREGALVVLPPERAADFDLRRRWGAHRGGARRRCGWAGGLRRRRWRARRRRMSRCWGRPWRTWTSRRRLRRAGRPSRSLRSRETFGRLAVSGRRPCRSALTLRGRSRCDRAGGFGRCRGRRSRSRSRSG